MAKPTFLGKPATKKAMENLGWKPKYDFNESVSNTAQWYLNYYNNLSYKITPLYIFKKIELFIISIFSMYYLYKS